ncbi:unnamed protein product [Rhizoctonia solani]|uniref:Zn(2)-C6 fungal-type domain-containing protein n=1 Tax=Rhizoctonia solani TaxID=456999 RepID=A0A8H3AA76_9AGAM|nr:unnamed protein product [Rhizoctonia solani]
MSYLSNASCATCEARNKQCDGIKGPAGCQHCVQAGVYCAGYLATSARFPNPKHNIGENQPLPSPRLHHDSSPHEIPNPVTTPTGLPDPTQASRSVRDGSAGTTTRDFDYLHWSADILVPQLSTNTQSDNPSIRYERSPSCPPKLVPASIEPLSNPTSQIPSPPLDGNISTSMTRPRTSRSMVVPSQAHLAGSRFNPVRSRPIAPLTPESPGLRLGVARGPVLRKGRIAHTGNSLVTRMQSRPPLECTTLQFDEESEVRDPENLEAKIMNELVLDRRIESNTLPFLIHGFVSWSTLFIFETNRIVPTVAEHIRRSRSFDSQTRQTMLLISNTSLAISRTTDYNVPQFTTLQTQLIDRVREARARDDTEMTRELATATMEHSHQFISMLFKVGSLASVLSVMDLYAPIFRRACPEPSEGLVNLRQCLTSLNVQLKYYACLDVLQSLITHRPMFFRYSLDFLSPQEEDIMKSNKGTGLRWMYGVPDQLMFTLARMNGLFEDFGNRVDPEMIQELETEIAACRPIVSTGPGEDPILNIGRITVQEAWVMATRVYLYMGLCGANSLDARVVKVQKGFMRLLGGVKSRRHPDSFLVYPIAILGVTATCSADRTALLTRLWGVSECSRQGTVGNDVVRMLNDVWAHTTARPAVWTDVRSACLRVTGM